jgi:mannose-6-phosphate isomerase
VQFYFPLLAKLLFTSDVLSVQVHPDDEYALAREDGPGKTEMWHVVAAQPGAAVALGLTATMSAVELCRAARNGDIERQLRWIPVRKGETLFIPPGTLHTIGPGLVLCEIQQNSDLTYRLYDFLRVDAEGEPRPLHIEQAAAVTRQAPHPGAQQAFLFPPSNFVSERWRRELLAACKYFAAERLCWEETFEYLPDPKRFQLLVFLHGTGRIGVARAGEAYRAGDAYLIPAEAPPFPVEAQSPTEVVRAYVPDLDSLRAELIEAGAGQKQIDRLLF